MDERAPGPSWTLRTRSLPLSHPLVMGILNVTPDSFSDGGELPDVASAVDRGARMVEEGAHLLDVGGESTRPGAEEVPVPEELDRVEPVVRALASRLDVPISVDTRKAEVARAAVAAGAEVVNDVSGFEHDPAMIRVVAETGAGAVVMHMRGTPGTMDRLAEYGDVCGEVTEALARRVARAVDGGVERERLTVDPGLGFAKTPEHSYTLLAGLDRIASLGLPVLVGPSRKRFLGVAVDRPPADRACATAGACVAALFRGGHIFRVHDVGPVADALAVAHAVRQAGVRDPERRR